MGKLKGVLPITGTFGNISFIDTPAGIVVKTKSSVSRKKLLEGMEYERSRENNREFAAATQACKLIRHAFRGGVFADPGHPFRNSLMSRLLKIVRTDKQHIRGRRTIQNGDLTLLHQIEFNHEHRLYERFFANYTISAGHASGLVTAGFGSFYADCAVDAPKVTTHYRLVLVAAALDFVQNTWKKEIAYSDYFPHQHYEVAAFNLPVALDTGSTLPIITALAVEFYTFQQGLYYPVEMGALNPMAIVKSVPGVD